MGTCLRVFLNRKQDQTLLKLKIVDLLIKLKVCAKVIRLNAHKWNVTNITKITKITANGRWTDQKSEKFYIDAKS